MWDFANLWAVIWDWLRWLWPMAQNEFMEAPIATSFQLTVIPALVFGALVLLWKKFCNWLARRRVKNILDSFKPGEINERRKVFGRDAAVADLRALLIAGGQGAVVPVQTGGGGVGKTTLCRYYARTHAADYDQVHMLRAETEQSLIADLAALALQLNPSLSQDKGLRPLAMLARQMIVSDAAKHRWLLIFDNVETQQIMLDWRMQARHLHVLVTSRFPDWQADGFIVRPLGVLALADAVTLLRNEAGRDDPGLGDLATTLGRLPLALVQAGEWLRVNPGRSAADFAAKVDHLRQRVDVPGMTTEQDRTTAAVVELTLKRLGADARALVDVLAWYAPEGLDAALLARLAEKHWQYRWRSAFGRQVPRRIWQIARDDTRRRAAFAELRLAALLEDDADVPGTYKMHRVFQTVIRAQVRIDRRAGFRKARAAAAVLAVQFPGGANSPQLERNRDTCRALMPHVQAIWALAGPLWQGAGAGWIGRRWIIC